MRLLLAGLFVFVLLLTFVGLVGEYIEIWGHPVFWGIICSIVFFILVGIAAYFFNKKSYRPDGKTPEQRIKEWEASGLVENRTYKALRYFEMNEFEDEGSHYFIELEDKNVLYLNGQYLYDYEEINDEDDPEFNQNKKFPCSIFTIQINKEGRFVFNIILNENLIKDDFVSLDFPKWYGNKGTVFYDDMDVIDDSLENIYKKLSSNEKVMSK